MIFNQKKTMNKNNRYLNWLQVTGKLKNLTLF